MADYKPLILIVNGYGCRLDTPLRPYLDRVIKYIEYHMPTMTIFSGGRTQRSSAPDTSEAETMFDYVTDNSHFKVNFALEDNSYTTLENIRNSAELLRKTYCKTGETYLPLRIVIFCEATRSANVIMLARHFMSDLVESIDDITVETASWERADPFKQAGNLVYNKLAIRYPWLGLAEREHRRRVERSWRI